MKAGNIHKIVSIFILCFCSYPFYGQTITAEMHKADSCHICNCKCWHYYSYFDEETGDSVLSIYREHVKPSECGGSDIFTRYESKDYTFYKTGKIHIIKVEKGWYDGWERDTKGQADWLDENGKLKSREIYKKNRTTHIEYDENGKEIKRTRLKKTKIRAKF